MTAIEMLRGTATNLIEGSARIIKPISIAVQLLVLGLFVIWAVPAWVLLVCFFTGAGVVVAASLWVGGRPSESEWRRVIPIGALYAGLMLDVLLGLIWGIWRLVTLVIW